MTRCEAGTGSSTVPSKAFTSGYEAMRTCKNFWQNRSFAARDYTCKEGTRFQGIELRRFTYTWMIVSIKTIYDNIMTYVTTSLEHSWTHRHPETASLQPTLHWALALGGQRRQRLKLALAQLLQSLQFDLDGLTLSSLPLW